MIRLDGLGDDPLAAPPLRDVLLSGFRTDERRQALHAGGRWYSAGELGEAVLRTAAGIAALAVPPGGRVGLLLPNGAPFVLSWLALAILNVTCVPINTRLRGMALRDTVTAADLDVLLVAPELAGAVSGACGALPAARNVLAFGSSEALPDFTRTLQAVAPYWAPAAEVRPGDDATVLFTSGTTGPSKGVVISRLAQFWHAANYLRDFIRLGPGEVGYTPLPMFHTSAQGFALGCLLGGAAIAVGESFRPFSFWGEVRAHRARAFNYVAAMIPMLYHRPSRADDATNPAVRAVGSATPSNIQEAFERRFGIRLIESYGQTETAGLWLTDPPEGRRLGTMGRPARWLEAAVLDPDGTAAGVNRVGELALRPSHPLLMAREYFRDQEASAKAFRAGWYRTGDAATIDEDGYVRFAGRLKDFIRRRGENVSAWEVERAALAHPAVAEAAAIGIPSPVGEEEILLYAVPYADAPIEPQELDGFLSERLASFMRPRYLEISNDLPRTPTHRIQKHSLRAAGLPAGAWSRRGPPRIERRGQEPGGRR